MVSTANSSTSVTPPSSAAVSGDSSMGDSPNSATLVAMILLGAVFLAVVIALLIYRYYRRTSGPVWISKVFRFITCRCCRFIDMYSVSLICMQDGKQSWLLDTYSNRRRKKKKKEKKYRLLLKNFYTWQSLDWITCKWIKTIYITRFKKY